MNTFWLKIAGAAVVVVGAIIGVSMLTSGGGSKPKEPESGYWDQVAEDEKEFNAEVQYKQPPVTQPGAQGQRSQPSPSQPVQQNTGPVPAKPQFRELRPEESIEAERLFEMAKKQFEMGRLPVMGQKKTVDYCREIIRRWPDSEYAVKAKRILAKLPERYHKMYNITAEEIDLGDFK